MLQIAAREAPQDRFGFCRTQAQRRRILGISQQAASRIGAAYFCWSHLGASYAKLKDKDKAFESLTKVLNAGNSLVATLTSAPDLTSLRDDARFKELLTLSHRLTKTCLYQAEHRQFDFWIGEWNVQNPQVQPVGSSSIQRIEDGCANLATKP